MASVQVDIGDFEDGRLPPVCAVTGASGAVLRPASAASGPSRVWFLLVGWLVLLMRRSVSGWVPYSDAAYAAVVHRRRRFTWLAVAGYAALFVGGILKFPPPAAGTDFPLLFVLAGMVAGISGMFLRTNTPGSVGARVADNPRWVILEPVHPAFVAAYEDR